MKKLFCWHLSRGQGDTTALSQTPVLALLALPLLGRNVLRPISFLISQAPSLTAGDVRVPRQGVGENAVPALPSFLLDGMKVRFTVAPQLFSLNQAAGTWGPRVCLASVF